MVPISLPLPRSIEMGRRASDRFASRSRQRERERRSEMGMAIKRNGIQNLKATLRVARFYFSNLLTNSYLIIIYISIPSISF